MERSRIGVIGSHGRLGSALIKEGCSVIDCDVTDQVSIQKQIEIYQPEIVINCAAKTDVDACELTRNLINCYNVNTVGVLNLATVFTGTIVQISTDFIFDGSLGRSLVEDDIPSPLNSYGMSKMWGEMALQNATNNYLIIRTTGLFDGHTKNFATNILNKLAKDRYANAPKDMISTPVYVPHLAKGILYAIDKNIRGVLNIVNTTRISRFHWAQMLAREFGYSDASILAGPVFGDAKRPMSAGLNVTKAARLGMPLFTLLEGVREMKAEMILTKTKEELA